MDLFPFERRRLDDLEGILRAEEPRLAQAFDVFTQLTRCDGKPPPETQFLPNGPWREKAFARQRGRRMLLKLALVLVVLVLGIIVLGLT